MLQLLSAHSRGIRVRQGASSAAPQLHRPFCRRAGSRSRGRQQQGAGGRGRAARHKRRTCPTWPRVCSTSRPTPASAACISACGRGGEDGASKLGKLRQSRTTVRRGGRAAAAAAGQVHPLPPIGAWILTNRLHFPPAPPHLRAQHLLLPPHHRRNALLQPRLDVSHTRTQLLQACGGRGAGQGRGGVDVGAAMPEGRSCRLLGARRRGGGGRTACVRGPPGSTQLARRAAGVQRRRAPLLGANKDENQMNLLPGGRRAGPCLGPHLWRPAPAPPSARAAWRTACPQTSSPARGAHQVPHVRLCLPQQICKRAAHCCHYSADRSCPAACRCSGQGSAGSPPPSARGNTPQPPGPRPPRHKTHSCGQRGRTAGERESLSRGRQRRTGGRSGRLGREQMQRRKGAAAGAWSSDAAAVAARLPAACAAAPLPSACTARPSSAPGNKRCPGPHLLAVLVPVCTTVTPAFWLAATWRDRSSTWRGCRDGKDQGSRG